MSDQDDSEWGKMKRAWAEASQTNAAPEPTPINEPLHQLLAYVRAALDYLENGDEPEAERLLRSALITFENQ